MVKTESLTKLTLCHFQISILLPHYPPHHFLTCLTESHHIFRRRQLSSFSLYEHFSLSKLFLLCYEETLTLICRISLLKILRNHGYCNLVRFLHIFGIPLGHFCKFKDEKQYSCVVGWSYSVCTSAL